MSEQGGSRFELRHRVMAIERRSMDREPGSLPRPIPGDYSVLVTAS
jgi:hypothetical protein